MGEDRTHRKGEAVEPDLTYKHIKSLWATTDGVPVESINEFWEHTEGEVVRRERQAELGFHFSGDLYADKNEALKAALSFWETRRTEATAKLRAICKELGLTG